MWPVENIYYCDSINIDQKSTIVVGVRSDKEISPLGVSKLGFHNSWAILAVFSSVSCRRPTFLSIFSLQPTTFSAVSDFQHV